MRAWISCEREGHVTLCDTLCCFGTRLLCIQTRKHNSCACMPCMADTNLPLTFLVLIALHAPMLLVQSVQMCGAYHVSSLRTLGNTLARVVSQTVLQQLHYIMQSLAASGNGHSVASVPWQARQCDRYAYVYTWLHGNNGHRQRVNMCAEQLEHRSLAVNSHSNMQSLSGMHGHVVSGWLRRTHGILGQQAL